MHWKSLFCFIRHFLVEKAATSNILLQKENCFREQLSRVQIFTTSKNFCFDQQKLLFGLIVFSQKRDTDHDKKLNSILKRHYGFILFMIYEFSSVGQLAVVRQRLPCYTVFQTSCQRSN